MSYLPFCLGAFSPKKKHKYNILNHIQKRPAVRSTAAAGGPVCGGVAEGGAGIGFPANLPGK